MLNIIQNFKISTFLVLILTLSIVSSCGSTSDLDKLKNADNDELLELLQNGKLSERRQVSAILRNNVKQENVKALAASVSTDDDEVVVGNCAFALAKIGTTETVNILSETILSFSDFRVNICAIALASHRISDDVVKVFYKIIKVKPDLLETIVRNLNVSSTSNVLEFQNNLLTDYKKYPVNVISLLIDQMSRSTDKTSLPMLYDIYYNSSKPLLQQKAEQAIGGYPENMKKEIAVKYDKILLKNAADRAEEIRMMEIQKTRRLEKMNPPMPYEEMKENAKYRKAVYVEELQLVKDYATIGHPGGFNGQENEGELIAYNVKIENISEINFNQLSGYCYSYDDSITVLNRRIFFNKVKGDSSKVSENQLMILISPDIQPDTPIELFFQFGESKSGDQSYVIFSMAEIVVKPLPIGPFKFEVSDIDDDQWGVSEGNGNGIFEWGETCEMLITVKNSGKTNIDSAQLEIIAMNKLARIGKNRVDLGEININDKEGVTGVFDLSVSSQYEGRYEMSLYVKLNIIKDKKIIGCWKQILKVTVGESEPEFIDKIKSYEQFDKDELIDIFVVKQNNENLQELFLFNTEVEYMDAKSSLVLDE